MLHEHIKQILNLVSDGVMVIDKNFKIVYVNNSMKKITGYKDSDLIGKYCKHALQGKSCREGCPVASLLEKGVPVGSSESIIRTRQGVSKIIEMRTMILKNEQNDAIGSIMIIHDISPAEILKHSVGHFFYGVVGVSKQMREIFRLIEEISQSDASVLITGESGTGKELIANAVQATSRRKDGPYVKVNCSVFTPQLLASELFGHVKGAFTGADRTRAGRFEIASGGTLFLDEIGEMPVAMQVQLLRVLQEQTFERVGESISRTSDVRIIAATNKNLEHAIKEKTFREDLYYRLNVIPIHLPPLRDRKEDIPHLIDHFLSQNKNPEGHKKTIDDRVMDLLMLYDWPGNVRELENCIAYACARSGNEGIIKANKLPPQIRAMASTQWGVSSPTQMGEREKILLALQKNHWKKSDAAKDLGISRATLWRKMKIFEIND